VSIGEWNAVGGKKLGAKSGEPEAVTG